MKQVALVASEEREFHGVFRHLGKGIRIESGVQFSRRVEAAGIEWLLLADGQGARAAARACAAIPISGKLEAVGSIGYCGGSNPRWKIADVLLGESVVDHVSGETYLCSQPGSASGALQAARILTVDRVIRLASEKLKFGEGGFDAVEMEAAAVARFAQGQALPFFALKAVSDVAEEDLGFDFDRARRSDGSIRVGSVLAQAMHRPLYRLPKLGRLALAARQASENMGVALATIDF